MERAGNMLQLQVMRLTLEQAGYIYESHLKLDFPAEEVKPFAVIEKMWKQDGYYAYAFYENEPENVQKQEHDGLHDICAYAFLLADKKKHMLLLDYFAVCKEKRGKGYGSCALTLLKKDCADWNGLIIEVEDDELDSIDEKIREIRQRRISFYTSAGCSMTTARGCVWGVDYRIMVMPLSDAEAGKGMAEKLWSVYSGMYSSEMMKKHFEITAR